MGQAPEDRKQKDLGPDLMLLLSLLPGRPHGLPQSEESEGVW